MVNVAIAYLISTLVTADILLAFHPRLRHPVKYWSSRTPPLPQRKSAGQVCTAEGFFRNPDDCTKFYRCVDYSGQGRAFSKFNFDCAPGTVFDESISVCNYPSAVPGCEGVVNEPLRPESQEKPASVAPISESKTEHPPCPVHQTTSNAQLPVSTFKPPPTTAGTQSQASSSTKSTLTTSIHEITSTKGTTSSDKEEESNFSEVTSVTPSITDKEDEDLNKLTPLGNTLTTASSNIEEQSSTHGVQQCTCSGQEGTAATVSTQKTPIDEKTTPIPTSPEITSTNSQVDGSSDGTAKPEESTISTAGLDETTKDEGKETTKKEETTTEKEETTTKKEEPTTKKEEPTTEKEETTTKKEEPTTKKEEPTTEKEETTTEKEEITTEKEETTTEPDDDYFLFQLRCGNRPSFRRHPMHCNKYYRCSSNGVQIQFDLFTCDEGEIFDNSKEKCLPEEEAETCTVVEPIDANESKPVNADSWRIRRPINGMLHKRHPKFTPFNTF